MVESIFKLSPDPYPLLSLLFLPSHLLYCSSTLSPGCRASMIGNTVCDAVCDKTQCGYDAGDCLRSKTCSQAASDCNNSNRAQSDNKCGDIFAAASSFCGNGTHPRSNPTRLTACLSTRTHSCSLFLHPPQASTACNQCLTQPSL